MIIKINRSISQIEKTRFLNDFLGWDTDEWKIVYEDSDSLILDEIDLEKITLDSMIDKKDRGLITFINRVEKLKRDPRIKLDFDVMLSILKIPPKEISNQFKKKVKNKRVRIFFDGTLINNSSSEKIGVIYLSWNGKEFYHGIQFSGFIFREDSLSALYSEHNILI